MRRVVLHIDFNSYFATVEQQANPRLRGKPIGVTGGDRLERTVLGAVSIEAKARGVKGGMTYWEARKICPEIILVRGDSDKYLSCTKKFINILKDFSPFLEVFSIDECFMELPQIRSDEIGISVCQYTGKPENADSLDNRNTDAPILSDLSEAVEVAEQMKQRISKEVGEWV